MRSLPDDITIAPMPDDFSVTIEDNGKVLKAASRINGQMYELGLRPERLPVAIDQAKFDLRQSVWQLHQLAELGRPDLMQYAHVDRHNPQYRKRLLPTG